MKTEEKYNILIHKLRVTKPVLQNADELTNSIMSKLPGKKKSSITGMIIQLRPWISIAAISLVVLYIYQQTDIPARENSKKTIRISESLPVKEECLQELMMEKPDRKNILKTYYCYREQNEYKKDTPIRRIILIYKSL